MELRLLANDPLRKQDGDHLSFLVDDCSPAEPQSAGSRYPGQSNTMRVIGSIIMRPFTHTLTRLQKATATGSDLPPPPGNSIGNEYDNATLPQWHAKSLVDLEKAQSKCRVCYSTHVKGIAA